MMKTPFNAAFWIALVALATSAAALAVTIRLSDIYLQKLPIHPEGNVKFHTLPRSFESWEQFGEDPAPLTGDVLKTLGTENYLTRSYVRTSDDPGAAKQVVEVHLAYYTGMIDTVPHVPERCYVGGGMAQAGSPTVVDVPIDLSRFPRDPLLRGTAYKGVRRGRLGPTSARPGTYVRMPFNLAKDGEPALQMTVTPFVDGSGRKVFAGYFFIANGRTDPSAYGVRFLAFNLQDTYAYYAKVQFMSTQAESAEELASMAADLLNEMFPAIMRRVPDWVDVLEGAGPAVAGAEGASGRET